MMVQLVKGKANMIKLEAGEDVPFVQDMQLGGEGDLDTMEGTARKEEP